MTVKRFGKLVFTSRNNFTEGFLLRETSAGVVLEKYFDSAHKNVDVVAEFEGARMSDDANLSQCIVEAREYVGSYDIPIHVDLNSYTENIMK